jgi:spermidine synthase
MNERLLQLLSWVWDIPIEKTSSPQNKYLEVVWSNGKKMLNTKEANFSFGNGYKVFETGMRSITEEISQAQDILILGFGCGSILHLLEHVYLYDKNIEGIEYDPEIIRLFKEHFAQNYTNEPELYAVDALNYLKTLQKRYDIIFIDLFIELDNSPLLSDNKFITYLQDSIHKGGTLVFNTTVKTKSEEINHSDLLLLLSSMFDHVRTTDFQDYNKIITAS